MYNALKTDLATSSVRKDALDTHLGLALFVGLVLVLRRSPSSPLPWLIVLGFELANELMDIFHWHAAACSFELGDSAKDLVNTMRWPTAILLLVRLGMRSRPRVNDLDTAQPEPRPTAQP